MTDLATRIADAKQKAEAMKDAYVSAISYDLFLAMAARIEELENALEPMMKAHEKYESGSLYDEALYVMTGDDLAAGARAYRGEKG